MAKKSRSPPPPPAKRPRGRPPKPGGPTPQVEIQWAYRARLAAAGKVVRLVDAASASPVLTSIPGVALPKTSGKVLVLPGRCYECRNISDRDSGYCRNIWNLGVRLLCFHRRLDRRFWGFGGDAWFSDLSGGGGLTLQPPATSKIRINGNASRRIPKLTKRSGIIGNHNPLLPLIQQSGH
jgi:hypothetical protein